MGTKKSKNYYNNVWKTFKQITGIRINDYETKCVEDVRYRYILLKYFLFPFTLKVVSVINKTIIMIHGNMKSWALLELQEYQINLHTFNFYMFDLRVYFTYIITVFYWRMTSHLIIWIDWKFKFKIYFKAQIIISAMLTF